jgi:glycosyltransferase involved in cell wall biosynthesis
MSNGPLVTAILATYRRPQLLARSLGSIFAQTYRPLEVIAVDDGSGDDTPNVLAGFEARARELGISFSWLTKANEGPGLASISKILNPTS